VSDYYPENTSKENLMFLNAAQQAWGQLLDSCVVCPNRCISERNRACVMFDELD
jgi:uncharacterized Fe-S radical SAM superfamily protein PflX